MALSVAPPAAPPTEAPMVATAAARAARAGRRARGGIAPRGACGGAAARQAVGLGGAREAPGLAALALAAGAAGAALALRRRRRAGGFCDGAASRAARSAAALRGDKAWGRRQAAAAAAPAPAPALVEAPPQAAWPRGRRIARALLAAGSAAALGLACCARAAGAFSRSKPRPSAAWIDFVPQFGDMKEALLLLFATTAVVPLMKRLKTSPILGFLLIGLVLGPSGLGAVKTAHLTHKMADLGIAFFVFEIGLELSVKKVLALKDYVFGLGGLQFLTTGLLVSGVASLVAPSISVGGRIVLGGALALSSSAFALQLLREGGQMGTRFGRASFGVLLFQDLAVVPLLVLLPLLGPGSGASFAGALSKALAKAVVALALICVAGQVLLRRVFYWVMKSKSPEAFLAATLGVVLLCAQITEGLGLSDTLGAFVGGILVAETNYRHQVEADIAPFRGMLVGLFFITVGFALDLRLLVTSWATILPLLFGLLALKAAVVAGGCRLFRLSGASSLQSAALLAPGGEFAFVLLGLAERLGLISSPLAQLMVTTTVLSMATTPALVALGARAAVALRSRRGKSCLSGTDVQCTEDVRSLEKSDDFVVCCGWNAVSDAVRGLLDAEGRTPYLVLEDDPAIVERCRLQGLPVYLGDCTRREVLENFNVGKARLVCIFSSRKLADTKAAAIRRLYPDVPMIVRSQDDEHTQFLQDQLNVTAVVPKMVSLRFGRKVMNLLGYPDEETTSLLERQSRLITNAAGEAS